MCVFAQPHFIVSSTYCEMNAAFTFLSPNDYRYPRITTATMANIWMDIHLLRSVPSMCNIPSRGTDCRHRSRAQDEGSSVQPVLMERVIKWYI